MQRGLAGLLLACAVVPACSGSDAADARAACLALVPASRLPAAASGAFAGDATAFAALKQITPQLADEALYAGRPELRPLKDSIEINARLLLGLETAVTSAQQALRQVVDAAAPLLEATEAVHMQELVAGASASELTASSQLVMLSQRLAYSAATIHTPKGLNPEAVFLLGKDLRSFQELLTALLDGNAELRLRPAKVAPLRAALLELRNRFSATRAQGEAFLGQLKNVVTAREAQAHLASDAAALGDALSQYCAGTRGNAAAR